MGDVSNVKFSQPTSGSSPGMPALSSRLMSVAIDIKSAYEKAIVPVAVWCDFIDDYLKPKPEEIVEVQDNLWSNLIVLKLSNQEVYDRILALLEEGILWKETGKVVYGWSCQRQLSKVKIVNYTIHINLEKVKAYLGGFGSIITCSVGYIPRRWGGKVPDGTLHFLMDLKEGMEIPSSISISPMGEHLMVFVEGEKRKNTCYKCLRKGHIAPFCRYKPRAQEVPTSERSWAAVVDGDVAPQGPALPAAPSPSPSNADGEGKRSREDSPVSGVSVLATSLIKKHKQDEPGQEVKDQGETISHAQNVADSAQDLELHLSPGSSQQEPGLSATSSQMEVDANSGSSRESWTTVKPKVTPKRVAHIPKMGSEHKEGRKEFSKK